MYYEVPKDYRRNYIKEFVMVIISIFYVASAVAIFFSLAVIC